MHLTSGARCSLSRSTLRLPPSSSLLPTPASHVSSRHACASRHSPALAPRRQAKDAPISALGPALSEMRFGGASPRPSLLYGALGAFSRPGMGARRCPGRGIRASSRSGGCSPRAANFGARGDEVEHVSPLYRCSLLSGRPLDPSWTSRGFALSRPGALLSIAQGPCSRSPRSHALGHPGALLSVAQGPCSRLPRGLALGLPGGLLSVAQGACSRLPSSLALGRPAALLSVA